MTKPLLNKYRTNLETRDFIPDIEQKKILVHFEELYQKLSREPSPNFIKHVVQRLSGRQPSRPKGIYLWGNMGRGKTYLMDIFCDCLSPSHTKRFHFHELMLEVHSLLQDLRNESNPLTHIARSIVEDITVLCIDELLVTEIGDAMILSALFAALAKENITFVITSNTKPQELYKGLHRNRFLPTIDLITHRTKVLQLEGDIDYRLANDRLPNRYLWPHDHRAEDQFRKTFGLLTSGSVPNNATIHIGRRSIQARAVSETVIWFDFDELCRTPLSNLEFSQICQRYHTLLLSNIPLLGPADEEAVRRFVDLIDQLYDHHVNVLVSAMCEPEMLYTGTRFLDRFRRSVSRLKEFQSEKYVNAPHRQ